LKPKKLLDYKKWEFEKTPFITMLKFKLSIIFILILFFDCLGQFKIQIDEVYEPKVRIAIDMIKNTDASYFCMLSDYCSQIKITDDTSMRELKDGIINIPLKIVSTPSLNRLSSWIVRQAFLLRMEDVGKNLAYRDKMFLANKYEMEFSSKLPKENLNSLRFKLKQFFESRKNDPYEIKFKSEKDTLIH